jgi:outer membrane lipoprotein carrier protein
MGPVFRFQISAAVVLLFVIVSFAGYTCGICYAESDRKNIVLEKLLNRIESKYSNRDFSVGFTQISTLRAINVIDKAYGKAFFRYPGRMRWEYLSPEKNEIITDGENLWIYRPGENQVVKGKSKNFFITGSGGAFLSDISMMRKFYRLSIEKTDSSFINLLMIPKKKLPDVASIRIRIAKDNNEINRIITSNIYGDTTELKFNDIKFKKLDDSLFRFSIPAGTDIIFMNSQF